MAYGFKLKESRIKISTTTGVLERDGVSVGVWHAGQDQATRDWAVTHAPSGFALCTGFETRLEAVLMALLMFALVGNILENETPSQNMADGTRLVDESFLIVKDGRNAGRVMQMVIKIAKGIQRDPNGLGIDRQSM